MRLLGLFLVMVSAMGFIAVTKVMHDELPKLIADASLREAAERCIVDAYFKLILGTFALACGILFLAMGVAISEARAVERNLVARVKALEARASALERENAYKDELLGRVQTLEEKSRIRS